MNKFIGMITLIAVSVFSNAHASSFLDDLIPEEESIAATNCQNAKEAKSEMSQLMSAINNDIIGTTPRFCRASSAEALNDKINPKNNSFDVFMDGLAKIKSDKKNVIKIGSHKNNFIKQTFFETLKMITIKSHWQYQSEDNKNLLLLSDECSGRGINKIPLSSANIKIKNGTIEELSKVCASENLTSLVPFVSADVIAETFLNLKLMFPENYNDFTSYFCEKLSKMDESIFLNLKDRNIAQTKMNLKEVEHFSNWFKDINQNVGLVNIIDDKKEAVKNSMLTENEKKRLENKLINPVFSEEIQKYYKQEYEAQELAKTNGVAPKNIGNFEYKINSKGYYIKKEKPMTAKEKEAVRESINKMFGSKDPSIGAKITTDNYKKSLESLVKHPERLDYKIHYSDGKGSFEADSDKFEEILSALKDSEEFGNYAQSEFDKSKEGQKLLKNNYEAYQNLEDKDDSIYPGKESSVILNKDGTYSKKEASHIKDTNKHFYESIKEVMTPLKYKGVDIIPDGKPNTFFVKKEDGSVTFLELDKYSDVGLVQKMISFNYQNKTASLDNYIKLTKEEMKSLKDYTGASYAEINSCLRSKDCTTEQQVKITKIKNSLDKLKVNGKNAKPQILYRGVGELPESVVANLNNKDKAFALDPGFMSSTGNYSVAKMFSGTFKLESEESKQPEDNKSTMFILKTKSCIGISAISHYEAEDEFLCPPGLKFKSKKIEGKNAYVLEEVGE